MRRVYAFLTLLECAKITCAFTTSSWILFDQRGKTREQWCSARKFAISNNNRWQMSLSNPNSTIKDHGNSRTVHRRFALSLGLMPFLGADELSTCFAPDISSDRTTQQSIRQDYNKYSLMLSAINSALFILLFGSIDPLCFRYAESYDDLDGGPLAKLLGIESARVSLHALGSAAHHIC